MTFLNPLFMATINSPIICAAVSAAIPSIFTVIGVVFTALFTHCSHRNELKKNTELDSKTRLENAQILENFELFRIEITTLKEKYDHLTNKVENYDKPGTLSSESEIDEEKALVQASLTFVTG